MRIRFDRIARIEQCVKLPMRVIEPDIKFNNSTTITIRHVDCKS